jgi:hypothetical protein
MKYNNQTLGIVALALIVSLSGVAHAQVKSSSSTQSKSRVTATTKNTSSSSTSAQSQSATSKKTSVDSVTATAASASKPVASAIQGIFSGSQTSLQSQKVSEYKPIPFAFAIDEKNIALDKYNTIISSLERVYSKIPVQKTPAEPTLEKSFPFSRPVTISWPPRSKKGLVYWFGGLTRSGTFPVTIRSNTATSTNMQTWSYSSISATSLSPGDPWESRYASAGTYFQGKMYMVSGWNGVSGGCVPDVWSSVNGTGWNLSQSVPAWGQVPLGGRTGHQLVVMGTKMYLIGGRSCSNHQATGDVWATGDGENWSQLTTNNPILGPRFDHSAVVLNNKIYVMGGFKACDNGEGLCGYRNDVISSVDGVNWIVETNHAPWLRRSGHMSFVSGNKMYVLGGQSYTIPELGVASNIWIDPASPNLTITNSAGETYSPPHAFYNDVWSSTDGVSWIQKTSQAEWIWRRDAAGFVMGSTMYVFGGTSEQTYTGFRNDVWKSTDNGVHWSLVSMGPDTHPVIVDHTVVVPPKNFGAGILGMKPSVQVLRTGPLATLGMARLRGYVTPNIANTKSWFEFGQEYSQLLPYNTAHTAEQVVPLGSNSLIEQTVSFPESLVSYATRIVAKNTIGTVVSSGMYFTVPDCASGLPQIWITSPIGNEIISGLGGETFYQNNPMTVSWNSCNLLANEQITIRLDRQGSTDSFYFYSPNDGSETFQITASNPSMWVGNYKIYVSSQGASPDQDQTGIFRIEA